MYKKGTEYQGYCPEREQRLEQIELRAMRKMYANPNMTVEEMREILRPKKDRKDSTINVIFLKNSKK